jgi:biotin transport system substrate-specific component
VDRRLAAADLARVAVFAGLIAALSLPGQFYLFGSSVPVTLQTLGVMLTGLLLGARLGALAVLVYLAIGAAGVPVFAGGAAGLAPFSGPTGGYLVGFAVGAFVIGLIARRSRQFRPVVGFVACVVGGILVVYAIGVPVLAWRLDLDFSTALRTGATIFLPGDLIKAVLATVVAAGVYRAYPALARDTAAREAATTRT